MARIGIAGAGVLGRLLAWRLTREGHAVSVFDPADGPQPPLVGRVSHRRADPPSLWADPHSARAEPHSVRAGPHSVRADPHSVRAEPVEALTTTSQALRQAQDERGHWHAAGFTAAGMLSPLAELDGAEPAVARLGWRSLPLWQAIGQQLADGGAPGLVRVDGSLLLAHGCDRGNAQRTLARLSGVADAPVPQPLDAAALRELEPALAPGLLAWLLPGEGQVLPRETLQALAEQTDAARWHWNARVDAVHPGRLQLADGSGFAVDLAIDTRGLGARPEVPLRGVRGEVVWLHAPGVRLHRPVRLLHPRHRVYLVPRPGDRFVIGASEIESEDRSPVSLRSALELMSAAHSVLPELAEARIDHLETNLRPARADHLPCIEHAPGLLRINGLFRHGWMIAPALVQDALAAAGWARNGDFPP